jgi:hypothetical protein
MNCFLSIISSSRNEIEHGTDQDSITKKKEKLVTKILWQKEKISFFPNRYLEKITRDDLQNFPLDNLLMTESQMDILVRASTRKTCVPRDTEIE